MAKGVSFAPKVAHTKFSLEQGIQAWVRAKVKDDKVHVRNLDRLNEEDLLLLARAMGYKYKPPVWRPEPVKAIEGPKKILSLPPPKVASDPNS